MSSARFIHVCRYGVALHIGKLDVELGHSFHRVWKLWVPDAAHFWWGRRGVHLSLFKPRVGKRVMFDRIEED